MALGDWLKGKTAELTERAKSVMADLAKEREVLRIETEQNERLQAIIDQRFPAYRFPRMPQGMLKDYGDLPNFQESLDLWRSIITEWPNQAQTEADRLQNEDTYWSRELQKCLIASGDGSYVLASKRIIVDNWWNFEKWNFRRYYAATGTFHPSAFSAVFVDHWKVHYKFRNKVFWNNESADDRHNKQLYEEAMRFIKRFDDVLLEHREKWGNWYFFNIEQTFKKKVAPPSRQFSKPSDDL